MLKNRLFTSVFMMLAMAGMSFAWDESDIDLNIPKDGTGCYLIGTVNQLYGFASIVNGSTAELDPNPTACGKLEKDIVVNENVLGENNANVNSETGEYQGSNASSFRPWVSIGGHKTDFRGTFDGQGHTISGLFLNAGESYSNVGLFGSVAGEPGFNATIKNVGIKDSYFRAGYCVGGVVGYVYGNGSLNIENVFNAAYVVAVKEDYGLAGGLVGYVENAAGENLLLNITNAYNTGSIKGKIENLVGGLVGKVNVDVYGYDNGSAVYVNVKNAFNYGDVDGSPIVAPMVHNEDIHFNIQNSFYLAEESDGMGKTAEEFANGSVFALLHSGENGDVWSQNQDDSYSMLFQSADESGVENPAMHVAVLHYSETDSVVIAYTEGSAKLLPTADGNGKIVAGWHVDPDFTGAKYSEIPATATGDLELYAKVMNLVDGYYEIADADMLFKFAELVNTQNSTFATAKAKLIADIVVNQNVLGTDNANVNADGSYNNAQAASAFRVWTPIGTSSTSAFKGSFNGKGHTISGLYFNNSTTSNVGLFGYTSGAVTIDSVGVVDSYFRGKNYVGSLVGFTMNAGNLSLKNSYNTGSVNGNQCVGGLVGGNVSSQSFNLMNSYNTGSVNGNQYVGGLVGKGGEIKFSYNIGPVNGSAYAGGLAGSGNSITDSYNTGLVKNGEALGNAMIGYGCDQTNVSSKISNSYYLEGSGNSCGPNAFSGTTGEFANGLIAIKLHQFVTNIGDGSVWGQIVGTDKTPTLTGEIRFLLKDGCFEIASKEDLYLFAAVVNNDFDPDACGKLTADIKVNEHVLANVNADGSLKDGVNFKEWTPIGNWDNPFQGTFHGQGHTISGLYFNDIGAEDVGLFGDVNGTVTIDSVGLVDSYIMAGSYVGGLVGFARGSLTISNSYNASSVTSLNTFGGLVGAASSGSSLAISNSYNVGSLNGGGFGGGLVGYADALVVSNSYNAGAIYIYNSEEDGAHVGGIASKVNDASTVTNSFNYGTISYPSNIEVVVDDLVAIGDEGIVTVTNSFTIGTSRFEDDGATVKSATDFSNGTVYAALHSAEDGEVWRQYSDDDYPTLAEKKGTGVVPMHVITLHLPEKDSVFAYTEGAAGLLPAKLDDGSILIWYKDENLSGETYTQIAATENGDLAFYAKVMKLDSDGYYEVADADMLFKFAELVNTQNSTYRSAKVKLTADIVVNEHVLADANGVSNVNSTGAYIGSDSASFRKWTPIGNSTNRFQGAFDGQGHTISGLYVNEPQACSGECPNSVNIGLFGAVANATDDGTVFIRNVGVEDSYFAGHSHIGGIVGDFNSEGNLNIENSYSVATIYATAQSGGLVGYIQNTNVKIENSYSDGNFKCNDECGALVGTDYSLTMDVANSYYLEGVKSKFGTAASSDAFANGTVATLLHGTDADSLWGQNVTGGESHPTFFKGINVEVGPGVIAGGPEMSTITLSYPDVTDSSFTYVEGWGASLPEKDKKGDYIIWYDDSGNFYNEVSSTVSGDLNLHAVVFKPGNDGFYEIDDVAKLYKFAAIVNGGNGDVNAKLTADIEVNKNVLATAGGVSNVNTTTGAYTGNTTGLREWTPIGYCDEDLNCLPFTGIFDGQGHTISGLYYNDENANEVGLFGYVAGNGATVSISNVGIEDSYFRAYADVGGIVGGVYDGNVTLNIENVYNAATVVVDEDGYGDVGGIVGEVYNGPTLNVTNAYNVGTIIGDMVGGLIGDASNDPRTTSVTVNNSYNYGSVACSIDECDQGALVGSVADADVSVTNSYYLGDAAQGDYGTVKSADEFADGPVFAALRGADESGSWYQYQGDAYPSLSTKSGTPIHAVTLAFSETDVQYIPYVQGVATSLPTEDKDGNAIIGWTASADGTGDVITEIPASATTDLKLYAKVETFKPNAEGYYEITSADDLYKFAELVNSDKERDAKAKLMNDIVVNENVLATAGGASNVDATTGEYTNASAAAGFREWTPIGTHGNAFKGAFDGQGYTISGLYFNDSEAEYVGLFGYVLGNVKNPAIEVSIANVGVEDSYFNGKNYVGGVIGSAERGVALDFENIYSTAVVVGTSYVGGIAGEIAVGEGFADATLNMTNAYHSGSVIGFSNVGGLVGKLDDMTSATIKNAYSYDENVALLGSVTGSPSVTNSYYLADETSGSYGSNASASDFENGTVLAALRAGEGGYVWVQAEGDKYPTIDVNASTNAKTIVLDWTSADYSTTLADAGYTVGAMVVVKDGQKFYADGDVYEGILSAEQVAAIGTNKLYPVSGLDLEKVDGKLVATLNGDSNEPLLIPTDVHVDKVVYKRNVQANTFCTIMLPFTVPVAAVSDHSFYKFRRVATDDPDYSYVVKVTSVTTTLKANRPYIMIDSKGSSQIEFVNVEGGLTLNTTAESYEASSTADGITWKMKGVYEYKQWQTGDSEIGRAYLFTAQALGKYKIGQFAKLASGASLRPMRMYLTAETSSPNGGLNRPSRYGISSIVMPENIGIEIEDEELDESVEETTVVKRITIVPMLVQSNRWFDMKGRALNGRPTAKGTYYYNGKRIIIK